MTGGRRANILVLPGGGVRGIVQAVIILALHRRTGFLKHVDIFAGTSIGGIVALFFAAGSDPEDAVDLFRTRARRIFRVPWWKRPSFLWGLFAARFSRRPLTEALREVLGDVKFGDVRGRVALTSRNHTKDASKIWCNFPGDSDCEQRARDLAEATAAAPSYFDPKPMKNPDGTVDLHVDGGVYANDPTGVAFVEALREKYGLADCNVLVIGTGEKPPPVYPRWVRLLGWGLIRWIACGLLNMLIDGPQDWVRKGSSAAMHHVGGHYHYVSAELPRPIDLADARAVPELEELARAAPLEQTEAWIKEHWTRSGA